MSPKIGFTGDVMVGRIVDERQRRRSIDAVWGSTLERLQRLDGLVINLECVLSSRGSQWQRTYRPFHFRADPDWAVPALERAGVDACALANNHVLDYEEVALRDTLEHLDEAGIAHAGAGETIDEALDPGRFTAGDVDVSVVSLTDNTPEYAADGDSPGTAWIQVGEARRDSSGRTQAGEDVDVEETLERVDDALERAHETDPDLLVASLHWGPNMVTEPPEAFREFARSLVDRGVGFVHGHSAHVFHGLEVYDGVPIVYDAGDFVDDYRVDPELRNDRSFLFVCAVATDGTCKQVRLYPTEIDDCAVYEASGEVAKWARDRMRRLSDQFGTEFERDGEALVCSFEG